MSNSILDTQEEKQADKSAGFDSNCYWRVSQEDNSTIYFIPATDLARSLNSITHYDNAAKGKKYSWCEHKTYGRECEKCSHKDKKISKQNQKRSLLIYNLSVVGKLKTPKNGGEPYQPNPLQILTVGVGQEGALMAQLKDLNGDMLSYYKLKDGEGVSTKAPDPKLLLKNEFMFNPDTGKDQIFSWTKTVSGEGSQKKYDYDLNAVTHSQAQKKLGWGDKQVKIPDDIREELNKLTLADLAPHFISSLGYDLTDWAAWGLEPPAKGSRIGDPKEEESDKDSEKAKL